MYNRYADIKKWKTEILSMNDSGKGGYKEIVASITGRGVFARLKFESGVHRVQRVPDTEANGRIHTSAATVAVLPEVEELDIKIEDKDLRIDASLFGEGQSRVVVSVSQDKVGELIKIADKMGLPVLHMGTVTSGSVIVNGETWGDIQEFANPYHTAIEGYLN
jgi:hypothetical protein